MSLCETWRIYLIIREKKYHVPNLPSVNAISKLGRLTYYVI